jgi:hypothetical protein
MIEEEGGFYVPKTSPGKSSTMMPNLVKNICNKQPTHLYEHEIDLTAIS